MTLPKISQPCAVKTAAEDGVKMFYRGCILDVTYGAKVAGSSGQEILPPTAKVYLVDIGNILEEVSTRESRFIRRVCASSNRYAIRFQMFATDRWRSHIISFYFD